MRLVFKGRVNNMKANFSKDIYRAYNIDLQSLSDSELIAHFENSLHERRIYGDTKTTTQLLSMRWLRGSGIEIGAGRYPTLLYGDAKATMADCDEKSAYGTKSVELKFSIEDRDFSQKNRGRFDFIIASHVLEHADSFLRAIENLLTIIKVGGIIYMVLPDIRFLLDKNWLPNFNFKHHVLEYDNPSLFNYMHDELFLNGVGDGIKQLCCHADLTEDYKVAVNNRKIPPELRYIHHKHNYEFNDWVNLISKTQRFFANQYKICDIRYGHERQDCHFILERAY